MIRRIFFLLLLIILTLSIIYLVGKLHRTIQIESSEQLIEILSDPVHNKIIKLNSGHYYLQPQAFTDSICANCEDPDTPVQATFGLRISGSNIKITGPKDNSAVIHTNAGYGLYFYNCQRTIVENLTITDGIRDTEQMAANAAVVAEASQLTIRNNLIIDNLGDSLLIAKNISGIMGICGKNQAKLKILDNKIIRNSWDGIALFRDTEAIISGNFIDGVDKAVGRTAGGGRGVAIGVTWNAKAEIENNYIARYWKGIGLFVDAVGTVQNNIIEDINTWGISLWDAGKGKPQGFISQNIVYDTGAMGAAITSATEQTPGFYMNNIIVQTAQNPDYDSPDYYGYQCALALHSVPSDFVIENNLYYYNRRATDDLPNLDVNEAEFQQKLQENQVWIQELKFIEKSAFGKLDKTHNSRNSLDWSGTYSGILPCADCEGRETTIELKQDGSYFLTNIYLGKSAEEFIENGSFVWSPDGSRIRLINPQRPADFQQYQVGENRLFHLDLNGKIIKGYLAEMYVLKKIFPE